MKASIRKRRKDGVVAVSTLQSLWRKKALERDGGKCIVCDSTEKVNVHHMVTSKYKNLRYNLHNAICLCSDHHKFSYSHSAHSNPIVFYYNLYEKRPVEMDFILYYDYSQEFDDDWNRVYEELKLQGES